MAELSFDDLIPAQKKQPDALSFDDLVPQKRSQLPMFAQSTGETAKDVAKSGGIGLVKGAANVAGTVGDASNLWDWVSRKAVELPLRGAEKIGLMDEGSTDRMMSAADRLKEAFQSPAEARGDVASVAGIPFPTSKGINDAIQGIAGPYYTPKTRMGTFAETGAEFVPGAMMAPGNKLANALLYGVAPGVASEAAGQAVEGTAAEKYVRALAAIATAGVPAFLRMPSYGERAIARAAGDVTPQQYDAAQALMEDAQRRGVNLTPAEAIQAVTNGATNLGNVQRIVESTSEGGQRMAPFFAERPAAMAQAAEDSFNQIAPRSAAPGMVGRDVQEASQGALDNIRQRINKIAEPYYNALPGQRIDPSDAQKLMADPSYAAALKELRGNPELNAKIATLPDDSVAVVNEVVKQLDTGATAAKQTAMNPSGNNALAAVRQNARSVADTAATSASPEYRTARDIVAQGRERVLNPAEAGPTGKLAATDDVVSQGEALMGDRPSPQEVRRAAGLVSAQDPQAAASLVREHLGRTADRTVAGTNTLGQADQYGGAKLAKALRGNPREGANLNAAIEAVAGPAAQGDVGQMLDALQATGWRQRPGSLTAFNKEALEDMQRGGPESIAKALMSPLRTARDTVSRARMSGQANRMADLMMSGPEGVAEVRRIAQTGTGAARLAAALALTANSSRALPAPE